MILRCYSCLYFRKNWIKVSRLVLDLSNWLRSFLTLSCSARGHVRALNWRGRESAAYAYMRACSGALAPRVFSRTRVSRANGTHIQKERVRTRRGADFLSGGRRRSTVCACACTLPRSYVASMCTHTRRHACGSLCVGT
jgi:hypothetical protein